MNTTAMILAAGRGERMRPLTDACPKPLLKIQDKCLIEHHIHKLSQNGFKHIVINLAYKGEMIQKTLGNGDRFGLSIQYSDEGNTALEAAGGIVNALPLIGDAPFILINADIWTDFPFHTLVLPKNKLACLVMVNNPAHHTAGDFALEESGVLHESGIRMLTYSGIGIYHPGLFQKLTPGIRPLKPILVKAMKSGLILGQHYPGVWQDIGTPKRLDALNSKRD